MRNSLLFKLMGAFLLVIAVGSLVIAVLTSRATQSAFTLYTTRSGQAWAQRLAPTLADYYTQNDGWQGVDVVLQDAIGPQSGLGGMMGSGQGRGAGSGHVPGSGLSQTPAAGMGMGMMGASGQRLILTDELGIVISDSQAELTGKQISTAELQNGAPVMVNTPRTDGGSRLVGTLLITTNEITGAGSPAGEFITSVNQAILSSALIAGGLALVLGAVLFFSITAPLRQLQKAAAAISQGRLDQRVQIHSQDELGELGQTFNRMAENLSNAETQRRHLVADIAHELRTPLAAIQGTLEGMQDGILPLDAEQLSALHSEALLLNRLIGDLRLLSLAEAGQLTLERQETALGELIQRVVERIRPQAEQKQIILGVEIQPGLPAAWIDADRITQVLNNLIGNALRYTPAGGTITIQLRKSAASHTLEVSITDSGLGIDPQDLPYVFDRFYRADKSRTRASGGSGLGLAIVRQLVEAHGGKVAVESPVGFDQQKQGCGTRFSFTLAAR